MPKKSTGNAVKNKLKNMMNLDVGWRHRQQTHDTGTPHPPQTTESPLATLHMCYSDTVVTRDHTFVPCACLVGYGLFPSRSLQITNADDHPLPSHIPLNDLFSHQYFLCASLCFSVRILVP
eukprot:m.1238590 g.1238590  ORF g.1238590 m.1238590 type:complete len:121 (+) comp24672_c0_seq4:3795-4157(+)